MENSYNDIESFFEELRNHLVELEYNIVSNTPRSLIAEKRNQSSIKKDKIVVVPFLGNALALQKTLVYLNDETNTLFNVFDKNSPMDNFIDFVTSS